MSNPRTDIERGVIALLQPLTRTRGRYCQAVDHSNGEILGKEGVDDIKTALLGRAPGILVTTGQSSTTERKLDRRRVLERFQVELMVVSNHLASDKAQRVGDVAAETDPSLDPGINQMLWDIRRALERQKPVAGGSFLEHQVDAPIVPGGRGFTVWRALYSIVVELEIPRAPAPPIESYEVRNNLAPLTEPVPLPDEPLINPVITTEGTL